MKLSFFLWIILCSLFNFVYAMTSYNQQNTVSTGPEQHQGISTKPSMSELFSHISSSQSIESSKQESNHSDHSLITQDFVPHIFEFQKTTDRWQRNTSLVKSLEENQCDKFIPRYQVRIIQAQSVKQIERFRKGILEIHNKIDDQTLLFLQDIQSLKSQKIKKNDFQTKIDQDMCQFRRNIQQIEYFSIDDQTNTFPNIWQFIYNCSHHTMDPSDLCFLQEHVALIEEDCIQKQFELWNCILRMKERLDEMQLIFIEVNENPDDQYRQLIISIVSGHVLGLRREIREFEKEMVDQISGLNTGLKTLKKTLEDLPSQKPNLHQINREKNLLKNEILNLKDKLKVSLQKSEYLRRTLTDLIKDQEYDHEEKIKWLQHERRSLQRELEFEEKSLAKTRNLLHQNELKNFNMSFENDSWFVQKDYKYSI